MDAFLVGLKLLSQHMTADTFDIWGSVKVT